MNNVKLNCVKHSIAIIKMAQQMTNDMALKKIKTHKLKKQTQKM